MKQLTKLFLLMLAILLPATAMAEYDVIDYNFEVDGIYYYFLSDNQVGVTNLGLEDGEPILSYFGDVIIPETVTYNGTTYTVTSIGEYAFYAQALTSVEIPTSVTSIGEAAFCGCGRLTDLIWNARNCSSNGSMTTDYIERVTIGNEVEVLPGGFVCDSKITSVTIPNSVTSIGDYAFGGCSGLTSVTIPTSVIEIGEAAFYGCTGLTSVTIPNSVTSIGEEAFSGCSGLNDVYSFIDDPTTVYMGDNVFYRYPNNYVVRTLHVPFGTSAAYQADTKWSNYFGSIVEMDPGATNNFSVPDMTVMQGDTVVIPVRLNNTESIISFQTDIFLPEGLEIVQEDGDYLIDPSNRVTRTHSIISSDIASGAIRVMCYSSNYKPFTGNSGDDLFYITVKVAEDARGDYCILLRNTLFTNTDFDEIAAPDVMANVTVNGYKLGDANGSGTITVTDVVVTSQYVLEQNPYPFIFWAADVNADGNITVTDVSRIAWMVLNPSLGAPRRAPALWNNGDRMSGEGITLAAGETRTVSIMLDNEMDYSAFQLDLALPDGLTAGNFRLTDRAGSHTFDVNILANGKTRVLCYSPTLKAIRGNEGALLTFDVTATTAIDGAINVDGIELVTTDCQTVRLDAFAIGVNSATTVSETVAGKTIAKVEYYNVAGQRLDRHESGVTLVVTTYTDGTRSTTKIIK